MIYVGAALFVGLLLITRKSRRVPWWLTGLFALLAGAFIVDTAVGGFAVDGVQFVAEFVAGFAGTSAARIAAVAAILLVVVIILALWDKSVDKRETIGLIVLPILFVVASGSVADGGSRLYDSVQQGGTSLMTSVTG